MIDCPNGDIRDLLPEYLNDVLSATRRAEVEVHLSGCEACRAELEVLRALRATARRAPAVDVEAIAAAIPPYRAIARRRSWTGLRTAAVIAAIAIGGTSIALLRDGGDRRSRAVSETVAVAPTVTPRDSAGVVAIPAQPTTEAGDSAIPTASRAVGATQELAMAGGAIGELSESELGALVEGLESLDALPSTELEGAESAASPALEESR